MTIVSVHPIESDPSGGGQNSPKVDIIVPCYNYGRFLKACLGSVLDQPRYQGRALIIDDCSTDDWLDVARTIATEDPRVQVVAHTVNQGHIALYNEGIEWLAANYMLLLSSENMLAPASGAADHSQALWQLLVMEGFVAEREAAPASPEVAHVEASP